MSFRLLSYNIRHGGRGCEEHIAAVVSSCQEETVTRGEGVHGDAIEGAPGRLVGGAVRSVVVEWIAGREGPSPFQVSKCVGHTR